MTQIESIGGMAWVVDPGPGPGSQLAAGLAALGRRVVLIGSTAADAAQGATVAKADFSSKAVVADALRAIEARSGIPELIVYTDVPPECLEPCEFSAIGTPLWTRAFQAALRRNLFVIQAVSEVLAGRAASLVMVGPSAAFVGAAGLVPLSALAEGQRALIKSAARQSGARKLRLNWLAVSSAAFASQLAKADLPLVPELGPPPLPLGRVPDLQHDAAAVLHFLGGAGGSALTGATLNLDGGEWMLP